MNRKVLSIIILIITYFLNATVAPLLTFKGIKPDFIMPVVVSLSLMQGGISGASYGLGIGFIIDALFSPVLGMMMCIYGIAGYISGLLNMRVRGHRYIMPVVVCIIFSFVKEIVMFGYVFFSLSEISYSVATRLIYGPLLSGAIMLFIFQAVYKKFFSVYAIGKRVL